MKTTFYGCLATIIMYQMASAQVPEKSRSSEVNTRIGTATRLMPSCPTASASWSRPGAEQLELVPLLPLVSSLAGPLIQPAIERSIDLFVQWMKQRETGLSATSTGRDASVLYSQRGSNAVIRNGCLVFTRGELGSDEIFEERKSGNGDPFWTWARLQLLRRGFEEPANESGSEHNLPARIGQISLVAPPLVYAEFPFRFDSPSGARNMALTISFLDYQATAAERLGSGRKDLLFSFIFQQPTLDTNGGSKTFGRFDISVSMVTVGSRFSAQALSDKNSSFQPLPPGKTAQNAFDPVAVGVLGTLAETERAGDLELAMAELAEKNKSVAATSVAELVNKIMEANDSQGKTSPQNKQ